MIRHEYERLVVAGDRLFVPFEAEQRVSQIAPCCTVVWIGSQQALCVGTCFLESLDAPSRSCRSQHASEREISARQRILQTPYTREHSPLGALQRKGYEVVRDSDWNVSEAQTLGQCHRGDLMGPRKEQRPRHITCPPHDPVMEP